MSLEKLGLEDGATEADVKARYREMVKLAHPDAEGGSAEAFQSLKDSYDQALKEVQFGQTVANARSQLHAIREAARGARCPRCDGTGEAMRRVVPGSFKPIIKRCTMCRGTGKIQ